MIFSRISLTTLLFALMASLALCASPVLAQDEAEEESGEVVAGPAGASTAEWSAGMSIPFDGSSTEAFNASLEKIKAETTDAEFTTVQNALDYMLVYDLASRGDPEALYKRLDGTTPAEMVKQVRWKTGR